MEGTGGVPPLRVQSLRGELAERYADSLTEYQQRYRDLMAALWNDAISLQEFEKMTDTLRTEVIALKRVRLDLRRHRRRDGGTDGDGKASC